MNDFDFLKQKFYELKREGCQVIPKNSTGDIGTYFERRLGLSNNDFSVADFNGIEIKVKSYNSDYPINLFSLTCDGPDFFELRRFVERFGIKDREYPNVKILSIVLSNSEYTYWGRYMKMKLYIDYSKKKVFILVANANGKVIEKRAFWNFSSIENVVNRKINTLCYVNAKVIYSYKNRYVWYDNISFYKLKNFNCFIKLLHEGKIKVCIKFGVYRKGNKKGTSFDHGTAFILEQESINELFDLL